MTLSLENILRYWRMSLADGALGRGRFRNAERERFMQLSSDTLHSGKLPPEQAKRIFAGEDDTTQAVSVRLWPLVTARKSSHAATIRDGLPEIVAPIVTEGFVSREGRITPKSTTIARDILAPMPDGVFSIGTVDDLDGFLTRNPFLPDEQGYVWKQYRDHCHAMLDAVARGWPRCDRDYGANETGFLEVSDSAPATVRQILDLYDALLEGRPDTPLLESWCLPAPGTASLPDDGDNLAGRLGHSNDRFPLADHQRQVLTCLAHEACGPVLAVNGPPGTGKTTMLLSAIADMWIRAALAQDDPPVVVAASTNNQAVTNIIDAFGKDFAHGQGPFAGRWLPGIDSFGLFLPAASRENEAAAKYQTERFFLDVESEAYFVNAKQAFLSAGRAAFPDLVDPDVSEIVSALHERIVAHAGLLAGVARARQSMKIGQDELSAALGDNPDAAVKKLRAERDRQTANRDRQVAVKRQWQRHQASESVFMLLFGFLPPLARQRLLQAKIALEEAGCDPDIAGCADLEAIDQAVRTAVKDATVALHDGEAALANARLLRQNLQSAQEEWETAVAALCADPIPVEGAAALDRHADCNTRFDLFLLATHYWEGRWLLAMAADLADIVDSHNKTGMKTVAPRWRRRMMLTPCAVCTFASLPRKMTYTKGPSDDFREHHLLNFIDLLIIDEAGQALPEVAGASMALARRALVIGDTQQIEPISSVPRPVDIGNLRECALLPSDFGEDALERLSARGLRSVGGSAMRLAQEACRFAPFPEMERGLYLFEHRRCYDEIIGYCNALCYKGALQPKRGAAPDDESLSGFRYLHIDGMATKHGSSRSNAVEARTVAAWLAANRTVLEAQYGRRLEEIVGVVTPFGRQAREIGQACADQGLDMGKRTGMTVGTVHALQGAERPVVLFSPVYSKHADGRFIDASPGMLNVTVSRARDSFLVFGDMDVFSGAEPGSPRALLASFLFASEDSALQFRPEPRGDLQQDADDLVTLRDAAEHDAFLLQALASDAQRFVIVSPWIVVTTMQRSGLLEGFRAAAARGAQIEIFTDPKLNEKRDSEDISQLEAAGRVLSESGIALHKVRRLHSKIVAIDTDSICIGSYNWLSADRSGKYARHETSMVYSGRRVKRGSSPKCAG